VYKAIIQPIGKKAVVDETFYFPMSFYAATEVSVKSTQIRNWKRRRTVWLLLIVKQVEQ
jgi:hypothetical protein